MEYPPYGWRGRLGLIYIASAYAMDVEFNMLAPEGVTTHTTRVALSDDPNHFTVGDVSNLHEDVLSATKLLAQAPLNAIAFGCTSGSFVSGPNGDQKMREQMEAIANIPCTTTAHAVSEACKALNVNKLAIATPYEKELNELAYNYFTRDGIHITNMTGLGITNDYSISNLDIHSIYQMAVDADTKDAEAVFISCTGISAAGLIEILEEDLQKPIITSNQATFWHALRLSNIQSNVKGFGKLFKA